MSDTIDDFEVGDCVSFRYRSALDIEPIWFAGVITEKHEETFVALLHVSRSLGKHARGFINKFVQGMY